MKIKYSISDIKKHLKPEDAWWTVFIIDPLAIRFTWLVANFTKLKPNHITISSFLLGLISAVCFMQGSYFYLILGALIFQLSFILDCVDGKLAKLTNNQSKFGFFLDFSLDRWRIFINLLALTYGQYLTTQNNIYLILGFIYLFLNMYGLIQTFLEDKLQAVPYMQNDRYSLSSESLEFKLRRAFNKRRLIFGITDIETDTVVFFIFPLFNLTKIGLIIGIIVMFLWLFTIRGVKFLINFKKLSDKQKDK